jgi:hypothetical protein
MDSLVEGLRNLEGRIAQCLDRIDETRKDFSHHDKDLIHDAGPSGYLFENLRTGRPITDIKKAWWSALRDAALSQTPFDCAGRHTLESGVILALLL